MYLVVINCLQTNGGLFAWDNPPDFSIPFSILCIDLAIGGESFVINLFKNVVEQKSYVFLNVIKILKV